MASRSSLAWYWKMIDDTLDTAIDPRCDSAVEQRGDLVTRTAEDCRIGERGRGGRPALPRTDGTAVPANAFVIASIGSANRDAAAFPDPGSAALAVTLTWTGGRL